ncbi:MAG: T9SS type A sorting domain-containing protein [Flavobacteriales bacterium]|nr:T9SS type A sorting domain-containing protein [Flavobacteriales bacterium]
MRSAWLRLLALVAAICAATAGRAQAPFDLDPGFVVDIYKRYVSSVLVLPDGRLYISGEFYYPGDISYRSIGRLLPNGQPDPSFLPTNGGGGKITPWGSGFYVTSGPGVRRWTLNGTIDSQFSMINTPYFGAIQAGDYHVYPDGRVLFSGAHELSDSIRGYQGIYSLIWFTNTGYLDTTQHHRYCNGSVNKIQPLPDGRFLLSGVFSTYEGQPVGSIIRVEADGALDTTFNTSIAWGWARHLVPQDNGSIIAAGFFRYTGETDTLHVMRLLPNGDRDPAFHYALEMNNANYGSNQDVRALHQLPDGRLLVGGNFDLVDGHQRKGLYMLDSLGNLLPNDLPGAGCGTFTDGQFQSHHIMGIVEDNNGGYYIHGSYYTYDDGTTYSIAQRFITRLYGLNVGVPEVAQAPLLEVFPNPSTGAFTLELDLPENAPISGDLLLQVFDMQGRQVVVRGLGRDHYQRIALDLANEPAGLYSAHLSDGRRILTGVRLVRE